MPTQNLMAATSALPQVLVSQLLAVSETTQYTGPANSAVKIAQATLTNTSTTSVCPVSVSLLKSGQTADGTHRVGLSSYPLGAGDSTDVLAGHFLGPGDFISAIASALVQTVTVTGGAGTFTLTPVIGGVSATTSAIAFNATAATVQTALAALTNGASGATVTGSAGGPYTVLFAASPLMVDVMTGAGAGGAAVAVAGATSAVSLVVSGVVFS